jgi:HEAT repeat protein
MRFRLTCWIFLLALAFLASPARADVSEDEKTLKEANLETDADSLLEFFRRRTLKSEEVTRVQQLIVLLGDDSFAVREKASRELIGMGPGVTAFLERAKSSPDPEVVHRVSEALATLQKLSTTPVLCAAVNLLAHHKPAATVQTLLDFTPQVEDEVVLDTLRAALLRLALKDGKADPALTAALKDKRPQIRGLAAEVLFKGKGLTVDAAKAFLKDADPQVRLRLALALADRGERSAVPVLIDVLPRVSLAHAWQAEAILCRLAGENTPQASMSQEVASREKARQAWDAWWKKHGDKVDLASLHREPPFLGFTLVSFNDFRGGGSVYELGKDGKERWKINNLMFPVDAQVVSDDRILVAEMNGGKVTERNRKGEVIWQTTVQQPIACQRLPNGSTFVASPNQIVMVEANGKQTILHNRNRWDIMGARRLANGEILLLTRNQIVRLDATGKEVGSFNVGMVYTYSWFDVLPNGNVLIPVHQANKVIEYDRTGKEVWSAPATYPTCVQRLPNGNTLVTSMSTRKVLELDRTGKSVAEISLANNGQPWRGKRR